MRMTRLTRRDVLHDKSGIATSLPDALGGVALKAIIIAAVGGILLGGFALWSTATASVGSSSGFQNAHLAFEKAVSEADVVVGSETNRVGLLRNLSANSCEVQTWQGIDREGEIGLQVDTATVEEPCATATGLLQAGAAKDSVSMLTNIAEPVFAYANLGGREITYDVSGVATLADGEKPAGTKKANWEDVRPYKVTMTLASLGEDVAAVAKESVSTGYTKVVAITEAAEGLRYVPSPGTDPIAGPVKIIRATRSNDVGDTYAGAREGIAVTFTGGVCPSGTSFISVSYAQKSPAAAGVVTEVFKRDNHFGSAITLHLASGANGSTGDVEVAASCVEDGVTVKDSVGYIQPIPATTLSIKQNSSAPHTHDLSWLRVSSLSAHYKVTWSVAGEDFVTGTTWLSTQAVSPRGTTLGVPITYTIVASVDEITSPPATGTFTTAMSAAPRAILSLGEAGATWTSAACPADTTREFAPRYFQQVGTDTAENWTQEAWITGTRLNGVTTPGYGRTVMEIVTRCVATKTGAVSPETASAQKQFYMPEATTVSAYRASSVGTAYSGAREGIVVTYSGGRCYGDTTTQIDASWTPVSPTTPAAVSASATQVQTTVTRQFTMAGIPNGSQGTVKVQSKCTAGTSGTAGGSRTYDQPVPVSTVTVAQGSTGDQHVLTWTPVSSLPTTYQIEKKAAVGTQHAAPAATTALSQTLTYTAGTNYGNKTDYSVRATVGSKSSSSYSKSITTPWPATPVATNITYTGTGTGAKVTDGVINWSISGSCPAGTGRMSQEVQNVIFNGMTGESQVGQHTVGTWAAGKTSASWTPSYAQQGYPYGEQVNTKCRSNVTGLESPVSSAQSDYFYTRMNAPTAPVFDGYNFRNWVRGSTSGYFGTCWGISPAQCLTTFPKGNAINGGGWYQSYQMDYKYSCPAGSKMNWSAYKTTQHWNGDSYWTGYFGRQDGWQLADSVNTWTVSHTEPAYTCSTLWVTSPKSAIGAGVTININRIWW